ncbi:hypothetical protein BD324DRAFT_648424 [Kockovaella imperatae]|uniref:Uncharacterized protein n=1 Tax=Kockovaella imperatae TaxID=4999 RepID=A0A1Y1UP51_9TREE|nr:hypothetical protein BD324DRAFT_648424 [Kockovaella imperatae]ORX39799.1 hypothetical protein BD324DRAFT_648424 [Kockovaella imperatae]
MSVEARPQRTGPTSGYIVVAESRNTVYEKIHEQDENRLRSRFECGLIKMRATMGGSEELEGMGQSVASYTSSYGASEGSDSVPLVTIFVPWLPVQDRIESWLEGLRKGMTRPRTPRPCPEEALYLVPDSCLWMLSPPQTSSEEESLRTLSSDTHDEVGVKNGDKSNTRFNAGGELDNVQTPPMLSRSQSTTDQSPFIDTDVSLSPQKHKTRPTTHIVNDLDSPDPHQRINSAAGGKYAWMLRAPTARKIRGRGRHA